MRIKFKGRVVKKSREYKKFTYANKTYPTKTVTNNWVFRTNCGRYLIWESWTVREDLEEGDVVEGAATFKEQDPNSLHCYVQRVHVKKVEKLEENIDRVLKKKATKAEKDRVLRELRHLGRFPTHKSSHPADLALTIVEKLK